MNIRNYRRYEVRVISKDFNNPENKTDYFSRVKYTYNRYKTTSKAKKEFNKLVKMYNSYPEFIGEKRDSYYWEFKNNDHTVKVILC